MPCVCTRDEHPVVLSGPEVDPAESTLSPALGAEATRVRTKFVCALVWGGDGAFLREKAPSAASAVSGHVPPVCLEEATCVYEWAGWSRLN